MYCQYYKSPLGFIEIQGSETGIASLIFVENPLQTESTHPIVEECIQEIDEYFRGIRQNFTVKLDLQTSEFQTRVLNTISEIPFGTTASYSDIANLLGNSKIVRAVASALAKNKLAILIPCHRVIGKNQKLTGYAWGIWRKEWLIKHEQQYRIKG
ncbi:MAG: methylated-DNA--[protein]-cysteine S-methyltransferase [Syntrophomonadaceae bacterium]|nr:methylated-DNA--[protein]-cysteine S-methyltransferase [Syntrophomonadaceae bacterium]